MVRDRDRDTEIVAVATELGALMGDLKITVTELRALLAGTDQEAGEPG